MIVLVVEDEKLLADLLKQALEGDGYVVLGPVDTAEEALKLSEGTKLEFALVDIKLAGKLNGLDLAAELARRWSVPTLLVSGEMIDYYAARHIAAGYVAKPYRLSTVLQSIEFVNRFLDGQAPETIPDGLKLFLENPLDNAP